MMKFKGSVVLVMMMLFAVGCGHYGKSKSPNNDTNTTNNFSSMSGSFSSSLDNSKSLLEVSANETSTFCSEVDTYLTSLVDKDEFDEWSCTLSGVLIAATSEVDADEAVQSVCVEVRDECLQGEEEGDDCIMEYVGPTCTGTVGDAEACVRVSLENTVRRIGSVKCETLTMQSAQEVLRSFGLGYEECEDVLGCDEQGSRQTPFEALTDRCSHLS